MLSKHMYVCVETDDYELIKKYMSTYHQIRFFNVYRVQIISNFISLNVMYFTVPGG